MKPAKKTTPKSAATFTDEEREAMREYVREKKGAAGRGSDPNAEDSESEVLAKIAALAPSDRAMAERIHAVVKANAPELSPKTWYGMPAYAKNGQVICFFQSAQKFKTRYATLGFSDKANLDEGHMWPSAFAVKELTAAEEARIVALLKKAIG